MYFKRLISLYSMIINNLYTSALSHCNYCSIQEFRMKQKNMQAVIIVLSTCMERKNTKYIDYTNQKCYLNTCCTDTFCTQNYRNCLHLGFYGVLYHLNANSHRGSFKFHILCVQELEHIFWNEGKQ